MAVGIALGVSLLLGLWNGVLVSVLGLQPIIATLILMTAGRGLAMLITEGQILTVNSPPFKTLGSGFVFGIPVAVLIAGLVFAAAALLTRRTALGMMIESVGVNPEASRQAGVQARGLTTAVYVFCAGCAGIAGLILTANQTAADANNTGLFIELDAILAVVIGGTSLAGGRYSLAGTLVGALVIQTLITTVYTVGIPPIATHGLQGRRGRRGLPAPVPADERGGGGLAPPPTGPDPSGGAGLMATLTAPTRTRPATMARSARGVLTSPKYGPVLVTGLLLVLMFVVGGIRYTGFVSPETVLNLLVDNAYLIVLAVGMTFVILSGGIDLSVGAVVALSTMIAASLLQAGWPPLVVIGVVLLATGLLGLAVGAMVHVFGIQPFIATLAAMFLARGLCYVISNRAISITDPFFVAMAQTDIPLGGKLDISISAVIALAGGGGRRRRAALDPVRPHGLRPGRQ